MLIYTQCSSIGISGAFAGAGAGAGGGGAGSSSATAAGEPTRPPMAAAVANAAKRRATRLMANLNLLTMRRIVTRYRIRGGVPSGRGPS